LQKQEQGEQQSLRGDTDELIKALLPIDQPAAPGEIPEINREALRAQLNTRKIEDPNIALQAGKIAAENLKPEERKTARDVNDRLRFTDTGDLVFEDVKAAEKNQKSLTFIAKLNEDLENGRITPEQFVKEMQRRDSQSGGGKETISDYVLGLAKQVESGEKLSDGQIEALDIIQRTDPLTIAVRQLLGGIENAGDAIEGFEGLRDLDEEELKGRFNNATDPKERDAIIAIFNERARAEPQ